MSSSEAIVFNGPNTLDFQDIRSMVLRIPEVTIRLREAQAIWDTNCDRALDFCNYIGSADELFLSNIQIKSLLTAIVQVGLYDRHLRRHRSPGFVLGSVTGDSALLTAIGQRSLAELITQSKAMSDVNLKSSPSNPVTVSTAKASQMTSSKELPLLFGMELSQYEAFEFKVEQGTYVCLDLLRNMEMKAIVRHLVEHHEVGSFVNIGPGNALLSRGPQDVWLDHVNLMESIDLDPMLNWFWPKASFLRPAMNQ